MAWIRKQKSNDDMWLIFALLTTISWAFADLFYKKGAVPTDQYSHIKTIVMVGLVMGVHGFGYMLINGISFSPIYLLLYFPVSLMSILSMAIGYFGLRYIELSVSSPVQNSSGATALKSAIGNYYRKFPEASTDHASR